MNQQAFEPLEFNELRSLLSTYAQTPVGHKQLLELSPQENLAIIERSHLEVKECSDYQRELGQIRISEMADPAPLLQRLAIANTYLSAQEMLELQSIISTGNGLRLEFREVEERFPTLASIINQIPNLSALHQRLRNTLLPSGEINEDASPELKRLRREINTLRTRIYKHLTSVLEQAGQEHAMQDDFVTVRNGRFVIPVRNDTRNRVPGVVHAMSSSGATAFVEPISTIEENNEMVRLKELEEAEVTKILFSLSEQLRKELPGLKSLVKALCELDVVIAKANFARDYNCIRPHMNTQGELSLASARHPLLEHNLRGTSNRVVPISLALNNNRNAMVISGPNAGGKTVVLKTVGLLALMAQAGMHVPAHSAQLPIFKQVLADIGDHQSIAANLSTFSSHIRNISQMASVLEPPALVMLDEVGTGTDPEEGAALGVAIVDYFKQKGAIVLVSTHYNPLKFYATETPGVVNASVEFNETTLQPTYRLLIDIAGTSSGIDIARRLGLQEEILLLARKRLDQRDLHQANFLRTIKTEAERWQDLNIALESERQTTAEKYQRLGEDFSLQEQSRQKEFEKQLASVIKDFTKQSEQFIAELEDKSLTNKLIKEQQKRVFQLKTTAQNVASKAKPTQKIGSFSQIANKAQEQASKENEGVFAPNFSRGARVETELGQQGVIEEIKGNDIFVRVGAMRFKASPATLRLTGQNVQKKPAYKLPVGVNFNREQSETLTTSELNVIGCTTDVACDRVDEFLDRAFLENFDRIRIVHGTGLGKLRSAISIMLKSHPHVANFYQATSSEGGAGATIVELRQ
ncbi:MAG: DNA mismatch repair protein MutS2 [bacterium]|nr:MAG: DNA mismatch repair protein MutS2 [bacterium]